MSTIVIRSILWLSLLIALHSLTRTHKPRTQLRNLCTDLRRTLFYLPVALSFYSLFLSSPRFLLLTFLRLRATQAQLSKIWNGKIPNDVYYSSCYIYSMNTTSLKKATCGTRLQSNIFYSCIFCTFILSHKCFAIKKH